MLRGFRKSNHTLQILHCPSVLFIGVDVMLAPPESESWSARDDPGSGESGGPVVLVVFIGGCTLAEITALRFLASHPPPPASMWPASAPRFVVLTTKVGSGRALLRPFVDDVVWQSMQDALAKLA